MIGTETRPNGMYAVEVQIGESSFTAWQNGENVVKVWANADLPHVVRRAGEWPAVPGEPSHPLSPVLN